jgi:ATP-dependent RNA helicase DDX18/HAS1
VALNEYEFPKNKLINVTAQLIKLIDKNYYLNTEAKDAYKSFLLSYSAHKLKDVYNVNELNLLEVCKCFGLEFPPKVDLSKYLTQTLN